MKKHRHQQSTERFDDHCQVTKVRRQRIRKKSRQTNVSHVTIRPRTKSIPSGEESFQSVSKKASAVRTNNTTHLHPSSLIQPNQYSWFNEYSEEKLTGKSGRMNKNMKHHSKMSSVVSPYTTESKLTVFTSDKKKKGWPDWTTFENEHDRTNEKKKKTRCSPKCIIASIAIALLLAIVIAIVLVFLLTKKTNTISKQAVLRWNASGITVAGVTNQSGTTADKLNTPFGITLDYMNSLYIADSANNRIQKYPINALSGTTVAGMTNGTICSSSICFGSSIDLAVDNYDNMYIADALNMRIEFWANGSASGVIVAGNSSSANVNDRLNNPYGVVRDPISGILYIADTFNNRVMSYRPGSMSGTLTAGTGVSGPNNTQLSVPYDIYFDSPTNSLLIANTGMNNIVRWVIGASSWTLISGNSNGQAGSSSAQLSGPTGITSDPMGNIYIADSANNRVQFFEAGQSDGVTIAGVNRTSGASATLFSNPVYVALDSQLNLYVSDIYNHRIQKFQRY